MTGITLRPHQIRAGDTIRLPYCPAFRVAKIVRHRSPFVGVAWWAVYREPDGKLEQTLIAGDRVELVSR